MYMSPEFGFSSPAIIRRSVVFPLPDGPRSATSLPFSTPKLTLLDARKSPYFLYIFFISTYMSSASLLFSYSAASDLSLENFCKPSHMQNISLRPYRISPFFGYRPLASAQRQVVTRMRVMNFVHKRVSSSLCTQADFSETI